MNFSVTFFRSNQPNFKFKSNNYLFIDLFVFCEIKRLILNFFFFFDKPFFSIVTF